MRRRTAVLITLLSVAIPASIWAGRQALVAILDDAQIEIAELAGWSGPIRDQAGEPAEVLIPANLQVDVDERGQRWWQERSDAARPWADITEIAMPDESGWGRLTFRVSELVPDVGTLVAYGVTIDDNGDGRADWVLGMDNQAPAGQHRAWLTNVTTGETEEKVGPPYGVPIDSYYPGEDELQRLGRDFPSGTITLDVLRGAGDAGQLFVWAFAMEAGNVVAWDYAPDTAWIGVRGR